MFLTKEHQDFCATPIIMVSETPELINKVQSKRAGATDNIAKPFERVQLLSKIWQYLQ
ncbi:MAG: response regulator [Hydrococcus sp. SU_1_0]|nr:response regulator [Hydrococcus sp. SU_1_0]